MGIKYSLVESPLQKGHFILKIIQGSTLDVQAMARNIVAKTTLTEGTIHAVIDALMDEVIEGLAQGHVVVIDNLASISVSLRGVFDTPDAIVTTNKANLKVHIRANAQMDDKILERTKLEKVTKLPKIPFLVSVQSLPHHILNYYMPNAPLRISGENLKFQDAQSDEGVFVVKTDGSEYRVPFYSVSGRKRIDFTLPSNLGDITFKVRARYSETGNLRHGEYEEIVKVMIATLFQNTIVVRSYDGAAGIATISVDRTTRGLIYQAEGDTGGLPITIIENGTYQLVSGTATNTLTVDVIDFESFSDVINTMMAPTEQITLT